MVVWGLVLTATIGAATIGATTGGATTDTHRDATPPNAKAAVSGADEPEDTLRRARNEYAYGDYEAAVRRLKSLLYPMRLTTDRQVVEARQYLALSYYLLNRPTDASEEFTKLLYLDPDHQLDPFSVAPSVIEMFETIRLDLKSDLDVIRLRLSDAKRQQPRTTGLTRVVETTLVQKSDVVTLLPFGAGQLQNGDTGLGIAFAVVEALLLATNIASYLLATEIGDYTRAQRGRVELLTVTQYASLALFGVVWSLGAFHAQLYFVPTEVRPPVVHDETSAVQSFSPAARGRHLGGGLAVTF